MPPEKPKQPRRHRSEKKHLAGYQKIPAPVSVFHFIDPLPGHQEKTRDGNQIDQRHKHFAELISFLHPADPFPAVVPVQSALPFSFFRK